MLADIKILFLAFIGNDPGLNISIHGVSVYISRPHEMNLELINTILAPTSLKTYGIQM